MQGVGNRNLMDVDICLLLFTSIYKSKHICSTDILTTTGGALHAVSEE